jgi:hypothetical protein
MTKERSGTADSSRFGCYPRRIPIIACAGINKCPTTTT